MKRSKTKMKNWKKSVIGCYKFVCLSFQRHFTKFLYCKCLLKYSCFLLRCFFLKEEIDWCALLSLSYVNISTIFFRVEVLVFLKKGDLWRGLHARLFDIFFRLIIARLFVCTDPIIATPNNSLFQHEGKINPQK